MTAPASPELLDDASVGRYLQRRGVLDRLPETVRHLGGGVSNVVLLIESGTRRLVVKQALPRLQVAADWPAKRERTLTEAAALRLTSGLTPGAVPDVVDVDESCCALTIEAAPASWTPWKSALLEGRADPDIAARLGEILGTWHQATAGMAVPHDAEAFDQLRLDPYYRTAAARHPALAARILAAVDELAGRQQCLVHGDYSPKNVLTSGHSENLWVIDFETAHHGNPVFDVAFLLSHLVLKAVHRPPATAALQGATRHFLDRYGAAGGTGASDAPALAVHLGCLLLARIDGKSPVEYLDETDAAVVRVLASALLRHPIDEAGGFADAVFDRLHGALLTARGREDRR